MLVYVFVIDVKCVSVCYIMGGELVVVLLLNDIDVGCWIVVV